ncbi:MAG TPA: cytidylate kinase-like family protein [Dehalococcoidia bacterium]|jgi:cytidylate kinase|nr:cytidylate kinase-like family protein [Dehalococcoidia bacterium]
MTASVVTFSTQMGSGGGRIARAVAEKLRFRYYDWEVISQAANEAGVSPEVLAVATSERSPGFLERMMARLAGPIESEVAAAGPAPQRSSLLNSDDYRQFLDHVVRELGSRGDAVIVNHSGQAVLRDLPGVLKVLVIGSPQRRVERLALAQNTDVATAAKLVEDSDRQRADYFKRVHRIDWLNMSHYDLALNVDHVAHDLAVDMVAAAAREMS